MLWFLAAFVALIVGTVVYDLTQRKHAILRNFPIIGHFRYWLESIGPELRQYIVTDNDEERPFSRDQRSWIYASAKLQNNYRGFGTDNDLEMAPHYLIIKHTTFPLDSPHPGDADYDPEQPIASLKVLGEARGRAKAFRPNSVVNISAMSFGSLGRRAVEALNRGAAQCGCLHNTGEGGIAPYHRKGGDLVWQIGTGYFGCRATDGGFDRAKFLDTVAANPTLRAIEVKLSQGAKPGLGGVLPAKKVTREIAAIRGIPMGRDVISPASHKVFRDVDSMLDFVEDLAQATGLPVGIKSAVGELDFWHDLAAQMRSGDRGVDFISVDGGEGGTGAAPMAFTDHVSLPFKVGFQRVRAIFREAEIDDRILFIGAGKLGLPEHALYAFALGCDMINVAREAMIAIGCIQAQRCHTSHCPTGVATHNPWLQRGLDPELKAERFANYVRALRKELLRLSHACGVDHPARIQVRHFEVLDDRLSGKPLEHYRGAGQKLMD